MKGADKPSLAAILRKFEAEILAEWRNEQAAAPGRRRDPANEAEFRETSREFLDAVVQAAGSGHDFDPGSPAWSGVRDILRDLSANRANHGYSPGETAMFVFSLKQPVFSRLRTELELYPQAIADEMWKATLLIDRMGLYTTEAYQKSREEVIQRQQRELLELSTPVVQLWDGVLALPLIGTLDSGRTQVVMESLLEMIVRSGAAIAIIDITGVPTVDTLVAQHLMKTVAAARLMGADCIISGIRPQIAQTIVHLGVDLQQVVTKASLADAFALALQRTGARIERAAASAARA
jgi:rsbT co-antagonist protein RsbR